MKEMKFISRHQPTADQIRLAAEAGFELVKVDDIDGFDYHAVRRMLDNDGAVAIVNAAMALNFIAAISASVNVEHFTIGVFENEQRPAEGGKPQFAAKSLKLWACGFSMVGRNFHVGVL